MNLRDKIILICIDEAHVSLRSQWGHDDMRQDMYNAPSYLRAQVATTTRAPVLAMTASAKVKGEQKKTKSEIEEIKAMCAIQYSDTTVITISPVLHNHLYMVVKKPPSANGLYGSSCSSLTPQKIGSLHVLWRIYLKNFVNDLKNGREPKRAILYVTRLDDLGELDNFLTLELEHLDITRNPRTCPWVTNCSVTGKITAEQIRERSREENSSIYLYITTSVMLFGLNIRDISIVILFSPFTSLNSILQAGGRAGRRQKNGKRKKTVVYTLYNGTDVRKNSPMQSSVRDFCTSKSCLKEKMNSHFSSLSITQQSRDWCCNLCRINTQFV